MPISDVQCAIGNRSKSMLTVSVEIASRFPRYEYEDASDGANVSSIRAIETFPDRQFLCLDRLHGRVKQEIKFSGYRCADREL